nr:putative metal-binding motif-containing protein [Myxococcota bacterium]
DCDDSCAACRPGASEVCEGARDENCDGDVDERCDCVLAETRSCEGGGDRVCVPGVQTCVAGRWSACVGRIEGHDETCNALDDDCDGRVDEALERDCPGGRHRCRSTCTVGVWGPCTDRDGDRCGDDD